MTGRLTGITVAVTRAKPQAEALVTLLEAEEAEVLVFPTIAIVEPEDWQPADAAIDRLNSYHWAVFTSTNAVDRFLDRLAARDLDVHVFCGVRVVAVGPATAHRAEERGLHPDLVASDHRAEGVVETMLQEGVTEADMVLIPRALVAREVLPETLREHGAVVDVVPVYRNVPGPGDAGVAERFRAGTVDVVTFTSASTVRNFMAITEGTGVHELMGEVLVATIGPVTSATARELGLEVAVEPDTYTVPALVEALVEAVGEV